MLVLAGLLALGGCGDDSGTGAPSRADLDAATVERLGVDEAQAACIGDYLVEDYSGEERQVLVDEGMIGLPQARWDPWLMASLACTTDPPPAP